MTSADGHHYSINNACDTSGLASCYQVATCRMGPASGLLFDVYRDGVLQSWQACLTKRQAAAVGALTPARVLRAFRALTWPGSSVTIEPRGGRTLVNLPTNLHTDNTSPTTQAVQLLGIGVTIEATPASYRWHFGAAACPDRITSSPGSAYPRLEITCAYRKTGTVRVSVDTIYRGRYRIGSGRWVQIPGTLTVPGPSTPLDVRQVLNRLVR